ncbi:MAG: methionyl-tRNA formyltransferase [Dehalococcoidales bacterium]
MRVVYMGTPEFSVLPLERLLEEGYRVAAVYTQPDRPAGRQRAPAPPPVKVAAAARGIPVMQPASLRSAAAEIAALHPDVLVVAAFGQILRQPVLEAAPLGGVNIHPSLLPSYRGMSPVPAAILAGDRFTGVSIMQMDRGMDTGPVLGRGRIPIADSDTTGSLTSKLSVVAAMLLLEVLPRLASGEIVAQPQENAAASYAGEIDAGAGEIDWRRPAEEIWRRVRAFEPWPGSHTTWRGKRLKIVAATPCRPAPGQAGITGLTGQVVALPGKPSRLAVVTGDGALELTGLQLAGKRTMAAGEFLLGQREFAGAVLPSA